jgi:aspartyl-tRNA(Asn)/glutamyl-tRNA(Gln) amidotransferase subunit C
VLDIINVFREDEVKKGLTEDEVFKNAPDYEQSHFKVPRVVE